MHDKQLTPKSWTVQPNPDKPEEKAINIIINPINNLPTTRCVRTDSLSDSAACFSKNLTATHASNHNLDKPQKEPLRWHCRLCHRNLQDIQEPLQSGALATIHTMRCPHKRVANIRDHDLPKCASCMFGKQTNRVKPGEQTTIVREQEGIPSAEKPHPGQQVFVDHFACST